MPDIVAELREYECNLRCGDGGLTDRAADEIERLRGEVKRLAGELFDVSGRLQDEAGKAHYTAMEAVRE